MNATSAAPVMKQLASTYWDTKPNHSVRRCLKLCVIRHWSVVAWLECAQALEPQQAPLRLKKRDSERPLPSTTQPVPAEFRDFVVGEFAFMASTRRPLPARRNPAPRLQNP